ncbi:dolichyl-P-Man:GDP-Man5GlcNAc2-PP-dolichyl alpha-1,3-mannosyltransferase [Novymonas esmeraldas]|uniref:dolichyl-P-Man:Man5GlcNAc2-PP-dolichol alpha-1,3-mannosyltransferase n=1 Tax=Novymonas esmeraldas TaxID=1808958 RepID=A0AAW0F228_9TRYP
MKFADVALAVEAVVIAGVIAAVPYTEIDWKAYMEEVGGFLGGELDYRQLKGGTGPLVYPGGFVWIYSALYYITKMGEDIHLAQWIFAGVYLATLAVVLRLYTNAGHAWRVMIPLFVSRRMRSLYVLRLFNDCWAMFFLFAAVAFIAGRPGSAVTRTRQWFLGCLCFSAAVSVKMNVLLFAPGLLYVMLRTLPLWRVLWYLLVCAAVQVAVGLPFLTHDYTAYLSGSFEVGRVFAHRWSVNYQFLDTDVFVMPELAIGLLVATAATWVLLWRTRWAPRTYLTDAESRVLRPVIADTQRQGCATKAGATCGEEAVATRGREGEEAEEQAVYAATVSTFFEANLVGVIFARSLHYQFYTWFFYTIPFVLSCTSYPRLLRVASFGLIRQGFERYPPTSTSSMMLQAGFAMALVAVLFCGRDTPPSTVPTSAPVSEDKATAQRQPSVNKATSKATTSPAAATVEKSAPKPMTNKAGPVGKKGAK